MRLARIGIRGKYRVKYWGVSCQDELLKLQKLVKAQDQTAKLLRSELAQTQSSLLLRKIAKDVAPIDESGEIAALKSALANAQARVRDLETSLSWRVTGPLRVLGKSLWNR